MQLSLVLPAFLAFDSSPSAVNLNPWVEKVNMARGVKRFPPGLGWMISKETLLSLVASCNPVRCVMIAFWFFCLDLLLLKL